MTEERNLIVANQVNQDDEKICRICLIRDSSTNIQELITPCNCKGTFAHVHPRCLSRWLEQSETENCDICRFKFIVIKYQKNVWDWLADERDQVTDIAMAIFCMLFLLYIVFLGFVITVFTSGFIPKMITFLLSMSTLFWIMFIVSFFANFIIREIVAYNRWQSSHFRIEVLPNPHYQPEIGRSKKPSSRHNKDTKNKENQESDQETLNLNESSSSKQDRQSGESEEVSATSTEVISLSGIAKQTLESDLPDAANSSSDTNDKQTSVLKDEVTNLQKDTQSSDVSDYFPTSTSESDLSGSEAKGKS